MAGKWGILARFVAFALACLVGLLFLGNTMANRVSGGALHYSADFTNVAGLRPGDDVRAAGVKVGRVVGVDLIHDTQARVRIEIGDSQPITSSTHLTLRYQSLLGQRYLALVKQNDSGQGTPLPDGAVIPTSHTDPGFDLTALLNGFEPLFATLKPDQVNQLAESIVAVLQGQGGTVESLVGQVASLSNRLADQGGVIEQILTSLTPVLADVAHRSVQVESTIKDLRSLMQKLADEHERIGSSIDAVGELSKVTADLVAETRAPIRHDVKTLRTFSRISREQVDAINLLFETLPIGTLAFARPFSSGTWLHMYICNMGVDVGTGNPNIGPTSGTYSPGCSL